MSHDSLRDEALVKAHKEVFDGISDAIKDPYRPRCHFRPPCAPGPPLPMGPPAAAPRRLP